MSPDSGTPDRKLLTVLRMRLFSLIALALFCSAAAAQAPGVGETRPPAPGPEAPDRQHKLPKPAAESDRALARCEALALELRDECLRKEHERDAAAGAGRAPEPPTAPPPQNPR